MMRVITGSAKGIKLQTPEGEATRPTSERAKEALFSMIQFEVEGRRVLDLFAGSGQLGIEALSRGAGHAVFVDRANAAVQSIRANLQKTKLQASADVYCRESISFLRGNTREKFDLIFLDPPYALGLIPQALSLLCQQKMLLPGALLVCETGSPDDVFGQEPDLAGIYAIRTQKKHGAAYLTLLEYSEKEKEA